MKMNVADILEFIKTWKLAFLAIVIIGAAAGIYYYIKIWRNKKMIVDPMKKPESNLQQVVHKQEQPPMRPQPIPASYNYGAMPPSDKDLSNIKLPSLSPESISPHMDAAAYKKKEDEEIAIKEAHAKKLVEISEMNERLRKKVEEMKQPEIEVMEEDDEGLMAEDEFEAPEDLDVNKDLNEVPNDTDNIDFANAFNPTLMKQAVETKKVDVDSSLLNTTEIMKTAYKTLEEEMLNELILLQKQEKEIIDKKEKVRTYGMELAKLFKKYETRQMHITAMKQGIEKMLKDKMPIRPQTPVPKTIRK